MTLLNAFTPGDGRLVGYCTTCGADVFNGPRHRCPPKISRRAYELIVAAKLYVEAVENLAASSTGTLIHRRCEALERARFKNLKEAIAMHQNGATEGRHEPTLRVTDVSTET
jgi:hypothetical protein